MEDIPAQVPTVAQMEQTSHQDLEQLTGQGFGELADVGGEPESEEAEELTAEELEEEAFDTIVGGYVEDEEQ